MRRKPVPKSAAISREKYGSIYAAVAAIPPGCVASYGQVAKRVGMPRGARLVGKALAQCAGTLPWHRVLGASGRISLPVGSAAYVEQVRLLAAEGITVQAGRVAARHFRWTEQSLDTLLWGPDEAGCERRHDT